MDVASLGPAGFKSGPSNEVCQIGTADDQFRPTLSAQKDSHSTFLDAYTFKHAFLLEIKL